MPRRLDSAAPGFERDFAALMAGKRAAEADVEADVAAIIADVRARGDEALFEYTRRFDRFTLSAGTVAIRREEIEAAAGTCAPEALAALELAAGRVEDYHRRLMPADLDYTDGSGVRLGARWHPIPAVGVYTPGGAAAYPSSVLMSAIPARVAGVERLVMTVPTPDGVLHPLVLAAARIARIDEVYRVGGAQAIAALAFGTESVAPVDKVIGPGNAYVAAAKRQVFGTVGIDLVAGPSEILVVADAANDAAWIAADLLSQAEHDPLAQAILITDDPGFAEGVAAACEGHLSSLPRAGVAHESWDGHGAIILVSDLRDAPALVDRVAPEHLELAVADPDALAAQVRNAGAIFLGRHTPEAVGDYVAGPSHVLPTSGSARFSSGLGVHDFLKRTSIIGCGADALRRIGPAAIALAEAEGLDAHVLSLALRLGGDGED